MATSHDGGRASAPAAATPAGSPDPAQAASPAQACGPAPPEQAESDRARAPGGSITCDANIAAGKTVPSLLDNVAATVAATIAAHPAAAVPSTGRGKLACPGPVPGDTAAASVDASANAGPAGGGGAGAGSAGAGYAGAGYAGAGSAGAGSAGAGYAGAGYAGAGSAGAGSANTGLASSIADKAAASSAGALAGAGSTAAGSTAAGSTAAGSTATGSTAAGCTAAGSTAAASTAAASIAEGASTAVASAAVAVVVVTWGELDLLERSLDALSRQDLQLPYEVVVVDDDPEPPTSRMVALWASRSASHGVTLRYLPNHTGVHGCAAARNLGWRSARAELIAFTGDDTVPAVDWLRQGLAAFGVASGQAVAAAPAQADPWPDAVFGRVESILPKEPTEFQFALYLRECGEFAGCNWFCRRSLLERLGGFDERFADSDDDTDMYFRLLEAHARIACRPAATVAHPLMSPGWGASLGQLRRLSSDTLLLKKHPQLFREKVHRLSAWHDLAILAALATGLGGAMVGNEILSVAGGGSWLVLTAMLSIRRLRDTAKTAGHISEVLLTSIVMPPLALFWRLVGTLRYRGRAV